MSAILVVGPTDRAVPSPTVEVRVLGPLELFDGMLRDVNEPVRGEPYEGVPDTAVPTGEVQRLGEPVAVAT